jgi:hypothetical protein
MGNKIDRSGFYSSSTAQYYVSEAGSHELFDEGQLIASQTSARRDFRAAKMDERLIIAGKV